MSMQTYKNNLTTTCIKKHVLPAVSGRTLDSNVLPIVVALVVAADAVAAAAYSHHIMLSICWLEKILRAGLSNLNGISTPRPA